MKLVTSNEENVVQETTREAFATIKDGSISKSLAMLTRMRGIGPATASLLLSTYDAINVPFFSDELFRYVNYDGEGARGWDRKINYNKKEYDLLCERVQQLRDRVNEDRTDEEAVTALELEQLTWVLAPNSRRKQDDDDVAKPETKNKNEARGDIERPVKRRKTTT